MFNRRREAKARARRLGELEYTAALHAEARQNRAALERLLRSSEQQGLGGPQPWLVTENHEWREAFRQLRGSGLFHPVQVHYSIRAHFEQLQEVAIDVLFRFVNPEVLVSVSTFHDEVMAVRNAVEELYRLSWEAWEREAAAVDTASAVTLLLSDARRTVESQG